MGNRAVITTKCNDISKSLNLGVYLHHNGGRDSIEAFLTYCAIKGYRPPEKDNYGWARLCQVIANFFDDDPDHDWGLSVGIGLCKDLDYDNGDNGTYFIEDWKIVGRKFEPIKEQQEYALLDMLVEINKRQPIPLRFERLENYFSKDT